MNTPLNAQFFKIKLTQVSAGDVLLLGKGNPFVLRTVKRAGDRYSPHLDRTDFIVELSDGSELNNRTSPVVSLMQPDEDRLFPAGNL